MQPSESFTTPLCRQLLSGRCLLFILPAAHETPHCNTLPFVPVEMEGGSSTCYWKTADYFFSQDASCPDTQRIYLSRDYLCNKVTVFHSFFLSACEKRKSFKSVCIGHYVLPPEPVQEELRNVIGRLIWECEDERLAESLSDEEDNVNSDGDVNSINFEASDTGTFFCGGLGEYPTSNFLTGYVSVGNLPQYSGNLSDFHPGCFRCCACSKHCCLLHT